MSMTPLSMSYGNMLFAALHRSAVPVREIVGICSPAAVLRAADPDIAARDRGDSSHADSVGIQRVSLPVAAVPPCEYAEICPDIAGVVSVDGDAAEDGTLRVADAGRHADLPTAAIRGSRDSSSRSRRRPRSNGAQGLLRGRRRASRSPASGSRPNARRAAGPRSTHPATRRPKHPVALPRRRPRGAHADIRARHDPPREPVPMLGHGTPSVILPRPRRHPGPGPRHRLASSARRRGDQPPAPAVPVLHEWPSPLPDSVKPCSPTAHTSFGARASTP